MSAALRRQVEAESGEGALLCMNPEDNEICSVTVDWSVPCIAVVWKKYVTSLQLRYVHELIIDKLRTHGLRKVVGNDKKLPVIAESDRRWINEDWMPRAVKAGLEAAASRTPATALGKWSVASVLSNAPDNLAVRSFESMRDAKEWLAGMDL